MIQRSQIRVLDIQLIYTVSKETDKMDIFTSVVSLATITRFDLAKGSHKMVMTINLHIGANVYRIWWCFRCCFFFGCYSWLVLEDESYHPLSLIYFFSVLSSYMDFPFGSHTFFSFPFLHIWSHMDFSLHICSHMGCSHSCHLSSCYK